jgi:hypothetical protein
MAALQTMIASFLLRELSTLRLELEAYPDERLIWSLPDALPNSAGTLTLHLTGNLQHYVGALLGGSGYVRDRAAEFAVRDLARSELVAEIENAADAIRTTLSQLPDDQLTVTYPEVIRDSWIETGEMLIHLATHLAYHLGQISYHRRLVTGDKQGVGALPAGELSTARPEIALPAAL